jgi:hypothetical protein
MTKFTNRSKAFTILLIIGMLCWTIFYAFPVQASTTATLTAQADAYVDASNPSTNYGTRTTLRTDNSPVVNSYLKFNVTGLSGNTLSSAVLRVFTNSSNSTGYTVHSVSNTSWGETSITYSNAPAMGSSVGSSGSFGSGVWTSVNVTSLVKGDGLISFGLTSSSSTATSYASRESGANAPQLVLTINSSVTATPTKNTVPTATATHISAPTSTFTPTRTPASNSTPTKTPTRTATSISAPTSTPTPTVATGSVTVLAAGDIANCNTTGDIATAAIINGIPGAAVLALGDEAYPDGTATDFANCYNPTWGTFKNRTHPTTGNHEYLTSGATGYFNYYGSVAGDPKKGYYSFNLGAWHIIAINSNCVQVGGCNSGNPQEVWLRGDLAANSAKCTLAFWHHPRFSSGENGNDTHMQTIWADLYNGGAEIVLSGHDHDYERFTPMNASGKVDNAKGIREFVVGTGGSNHTSIISVKPNSVIRNASTFGVLQLTLNATSYNWQFLPISGNTFTDSGSGTCH